MAVKSPMQALAEHLSFDMADLKECRYHAGHTDKPVYTIGEDYYCATKGESRPAKYKYRGTGQYQQWEWHEIKDSYINGFFYHIWVAYGNAEQV